MGDEDDEAAGIGRGRDRTSASTKPSKAMATMERKNTAHLSDRLP
jgi:hypothetical protein